MKQTIVLALMTLVSSLSLASTVTCRFSSLVSGRESSTALLNHCDSRTKIELIGNNNSPCHASDNLSNFLKNTRVGDTVILEIQLFSHSTMDGIHESFEVVSGTQTNKVTIETQGKCSSTHIRVFAN